jgi:copper chaperone CopZ
MNTKKYNVLGMSCEGCQKKISSALNNVEGIKADVNLAGNFVKSSEQEIDLEKLNSELKNAGNYVLEDPKNQNLQNLFHHKIEFRQVLFIIARWNAKATKYILCKENVAQFVICTVFRLRKKKLSRS